MPAHHSSHAPHAGRFRRPALRRLRRDQRNHHYFSALRPSSAAERARVVARLLAASQALAADPDAAALLLDGALSQLLALAEAGQPSASGQDALDQLNALEARSPAIAARVRLALQAHNPEARLAHCWALLDLLTAGGMPPSVSATALAVAYVAQPVRQAQRPALRKDS